jgi:hypothetical protein
MKLHSAIEKLCAIAPRGANWLCFVGRIGIPFWQSERGEGLYWICDGLTAGAGWEWTCSNSSPSAIDLKTGDVHLQDERGEITVVTQAEWSAVPEE